MAVLRALNLNEKLLKSHKKDAYDGNSYICKKQHFLKFDTHIDKLLVTKCIINIHLYNFIDFFSTKLLYN